MSDDVEFGNFASDLFPEPPDPARPTPDEEGNAAQRFFNWTEAGMRTLGFTGAADNLARYRSGEGGTRDFTDDEIAHYGILRCAEDTNRMKFEGQTFMAETGNDALNNKLLSLADGETYRFQDDWNESLFQRLWEAPNLLTDLPAYLAFGKMAVRSNGTFEATRNGDLLTIRGTVAHGFPDTEVFNFDDGQPGAAEARVLERRGEAAPFRMRFDRRQDVEATAQYEPDGRLMLLRSTWGPIR